MNREERRKQFRLFRKRMKMKDFNAKDSTFDLRKGDKLEIKERISFIDMEYNPIRKVEAKEVLTYVGKASNPMSNFPKWIVCTDQNGVTGMLNPNGIISNFKILEEK